MPQPDNLGFAEAANIGAASASNATWVAFLNPDAFPRENWVQAMLEAITDNPQYSAFASCMLMADQPNTCDGAGDAYHISGLPWRRWHGRSYDSLPADRVEVFSPCAGAGIYHRQTLLNLGGFDADFFCYLEDADLGFRLQLAGHRCLYVPTAVVDHIGSATVMRGSDFQVYHGHRNLIWAYFKNMPGALLLIFLPLHILVNLAAIVVYSFRGRAAVIWRAKYDAIRGLPGIWRKRAMVQCQRTITLSALWKVMDKRLFRSRFD